MRITQKRHHTNASHEGGGEGRPQAASNTNVIYLGRLPENARSKCITSNYHKNTLGKKSSDDCPTPFYSHEVRSAREYQQSKIYSNPRVRSGISHQSSIDHSIINPQSSIINHQASIIRRQPQFVVENQKSKITIAKL